MVARKNRDEIVLATKYTTNYAKYPGTEKKILINYGGNSSKTLFVSVEDSLKKLQTNYIDIVCLFKHAYLAQLTSYLRSFTSTGGTILPPYPS